MTEEVLVATEEVAATEAPKLVASTLSMIVEDEEDDCQTQAGQPAECDGRDMTDVRVGRVENASELTIFNAEAEETGFNQLEIPDNFQFPLFIVQIVFKDMNSDVFTLCANWTDLQTETPPPDPDRNVFSTCFIDMYDFTSVNIQDESGQDGVETDPEGSLVIVDQEKEMAIVQVERVIFFEEGAESFVVIAYGLEDNVFDVVRVDAKDFIDRSLGAN